MSTNQQPDLTLKAPGAYFNFQVGDRKFTSDSNGYIYNVDANDAPRLERMGCVVVDRPTIQ